MKKMLRNITVMLALAIAGAAGFVAVAGPRPGIEAEVGATAPQIRTTAGAVEISFVDDATHSIDIYSITGQAVKSLSYSGHGSVVIDLASGYYIVKVDNTSRRIVVR